jgi:hypothetical protein
MTEKGSARAYNDRNVYILGAGFSAEAGLPLIKNFMNRMRDAAAWLEEKGDRRVEVEAIESVLEFRLRAAAAAYRVPLDVENIEELFSLASASGSTELSDKVILAIAATLDYCSATAPAREQNVILMSKLLNDPEWQKPDSWQLHGEHEQYYLAPTGTPLLRVYSCPLYEFFLGLICGYFGEVGADRQDTIISFNYDTVVENALWGLALPFRYADSQQVEWQSHAPDHFARPEGEPIPLLKLHGSVNLTTHVSEDFGLRVWAYRSYADLRNGGRMPILVAPTWQKSLGGYLSAVWREAVSALRTATRVIILGYSMPQTDQHFRYLMAAGLQDNISLRKVLIVNNDEREEFELRLSSLFRAEHLEQKIIERVPRTVRQFLVTENGGHRIGRTLKSGEWRFAT